MTHLQMKRTSASVPSFISRIRLLRYEINLLFLYPNSDVRSMTTGNLDQIIGSLDTLRKTVMSSLTLAHP